MKPFAIMLALNLALQISGSLPLSATTFPKFEGDIRPITVPIVLKYRPFKKSPFSKTTTTLLANNNSIPQTTFSGFITCENSGNGLRVIMNGSMPNPSGNDLAFNLTFSLSEIGKWQGIKNVTVDGKQLSNEFDALGEAFKSLHIQYDKTEGYITGDNLHNIETPLRFGRANLNVKTSGKVLGTTFYNGREVMVSEFFIKASFENNVISGGGYSLIDLEKGFSTSYKMSMTFPGSFSKGSGNLKTIETYEILLAETQGAIPGGTAAQSSPTLRMKKLKKLLDMGLIDKTDYEKKKNEILNDL